MKCQACGTELDDYKSGDCETCTTKILDARDERCRNAIIDTLQANADEIRNMREEIRRLEMASVKIRAAVNEGRWYDLGSILDEADIESLCAVSPHPPSSLIAEQID